MKEAKYKREEERKFRRISIRFGLQTPEFRAMAIQISTRGLFISTNNPIFVKGSRLKIEIQSANGRLQAEAVVRHAPAARLRLAGYLWPEIPARLAESPYLWTEAVGRGRVIGFVGDPTFRDLWRGLLPLFGNAVLIGPSVR